MNVALKLASPIVYPESDGKPMADNTRQLQWIFVLVGNLQALFCDDPQVFVGDNQNWYPVQGAPEIVQAPDACVVFGRPRGHRPSWKQWEESDVPMTVVFEVLSPGNDPWELADKYAFYEEYGVEEYYVYDPDKNGLRAFLRQRGVFRRVWKVDGFVSPRLGIRFDLAGDEMIVRYPDGEPFLTFEQLKALQEQARREADQARQRAARLVELSRKARKGQASAEEIQELERLEEELAGPA